jgi:hypothetical protein
MKSYLNKAEALVEIYRAALEHIANMSYTDIRSAVEQYSLDPIEKCYHTWASEDDWILAGQVLKIPTDIAFETLNNTKEDK